MIIDVNNISLLLSVPTLLTLLISVLQVGILLGKQI
ncbi:hypothetical protein VCSRO161_3624 [Vibrio cholerae]|nr:hypothetical protein VCSRO161_3624 [Vibrio cholerae]